MKYDLLIEIVRFPNCSERYREIEEANKQIESLELSLAKVESEITVQKKLSTSSVDRTRNEYKNTLKLIHQELGQNVSDPRLDLEVYLRANSKSEIIHHSAVYQRLEKDDPKIAKYYIKAIAQTATTYKSLSDRKTPDER